MILVAQLLIPAVSVPAGIVGCWNFDEGEGTNALDSSGNGNHGVLMPGAGWEAAGKINAAATLDGIAGYVNMPCHPSLNVTNAVSVEAWIKPDTRSGYHIIACKGSYSYFFANLGGRAALLIGRESIGWNIVLRGGTIMQSSLWYHVVGTYEDGMAKIYVNGALDGVGFGLDENIRTNNMPLSVGSASSYSPTYYFNGLIDELMIYDRALNATEIMDRLAMGGWHFDETNGVAAHEYTGNANDGALNNMDSPSCWTAGRMGRALSFDGVDDYVSVPAHGSLNIADKLTVEGWICPAALSGLGIIASKGDYGYCLAMQNGHAVFRTGREDGTGWDVEVVGETALNSSRWYYVAATYRQGMGSLYLDGILDGAAVGAEAAIGTNAQALSIGSGNAYGLDDYYFSGSVDELKINGSAFSCAEIMRRCLQPDWQANWEFDSVAGGAVPDHSGNGNHGVLYNMDPNFSWVDGRVGQSLQLDGSNDYVLVPYAASLDITEEITVEAWVIPDTRPGYHVIACKGSYTYFLSTISGKITFLIGRQNPTGWNIVLRGNTVLKNTQWYHLAGTYKDGNAKVYVNGVLDGQMSGVDENIRTNNFPISIGSAASYSSTYYFQGVIDQVNIFKRELTDGQVNARFIDHGAEHGFGCDEQPTDDPLGGGEGYNDIKDANWSTIHITTNDPAAFVSTLANAPDNSRIFVDGDLEIDLSGYENITLHTGVILASDRGYDGSVGALIKSDTLSGMLNKRLLLSAGPYVRLTGLRLRGPHLGQEIIDYSDGLASPYGDLEVDNCEISGWGHAGVYLLPGGTNAYIHHNYIHHCQRSGSGYGVSHGYGNATSLIEANIFDYCRHAVAGTGTTGNGYEARYNLVLENANGHVFDMHGGADREDGTSIAGDYIYIHHNTISPTNVFGVNIRGVPNNAALINNNWFLGCMTVIQSYGVMGNVYQYMNLESELRFLVDEKWLE